MAVSVRHPRCWVSIGGNLIPALEATVTRTSRRESDTFTANLAIKETQKYGLGFAEWADYQPDDVSIIMATQANGSDQTTMITGLVDVPDIHWSAEVVSISGRDKSSAAIEKRTSKKFVNRKSSDIVQEIAGELGLGSAAVDSGDPAGKVYQDETIRLHVHQTYFELLSHLADREGFRWYVDGSTLYFEPKEQVDGVFAASWAPSGSVAPYAVSNLLDLRTLRNMTAAKPHAVNVTSWHHKDKRLYSGKAAAKGVGNEIAVEHHHNDHTQAQVDKISKSRLADAIRHDCNVVARAPGDLAVTPRMKFSLTGTGTIYDQTYDIDKLYWDIGWSSHFTVDITAKAAKTGENMSDYLDGEMRNTIARIAAEVVGGKQFKGTLVTTGYRKDIHAVKGMLVPHGIETGWVPIAAIHVGNGFGITIGPKVGDPTKLDGDQFDIEFDLASPNSIVAKHKQFSSVDKPPQVEPGEMLLQHESGNKVFFDKEKSLTVHHHTGTQTVYAEDSSLTHVHGPSGSTIVIDKDGNQIHDSKDKTLTVIASKGGNVSVTSSGGGSVSMSVGPGGSLSMAAPSIALTGPATLNGQPIMTT